MTEPIDKIRQARLAKTEPTDKTTIECPRSHQTGTIGCPRSLGRVVTQLETLLASSLFALSITVLKPTDTISLHRPKQHHLLTVSLPTHTCGFRTDSTAQHSIA
jgi:hypothetical protein